MKTGDIVKYNNINLADKGTIVSIGKTKNNGDCIVRWHRTGINSEEMLSNLVVTK